MVKDFTPKGLRQEINLLCQDVSKDKVLEQYMAVIQKEKAKLKKQRKNAQKSKAESSSEESSSDSDLEVNMIEEIKTLKSISLRKNPLKTMKSLKRRWLTYHLSIKRILQALWRLDRSPWISIA